MDLDDLVDQVAKTTGYAPHLVRSVLNSAAGILSGDSGKNPAQPNLSMISVGTEDALKILNNRSSNKILSIESHLVPHAETATTENVVMAWNEMRGISGSRKAARRTKNKDKLIKKIIAMFPEATSPSWWADYFAHYATGFLAGNNKYKFKPDLTWALNPIKVETVLEGRYDSGGDCMSEAERMLSEALRGE